MVFTEKFEKIIPIKEGGKIFLKNISGDIVLESWADDKIKIEAKKMTNRKNLLEKIKIDIETKDNEVKIHTRMPKVWFGRVSACVDYKIYVPKNVNIEVNSINGDIHSSNLVSKMRLENVNGDIDIDGHKGNILAKTINGDVSIDILEMGDDFVFNTINGDVSISIPKAENIGVYAKTIFGDIVSDLPIYTEKTKLVGKILIKAETTHGDIIIKTK